MASEKAVDRYDLGWDAAIGEVKKGFAGYIATRDSGAPVDPWEKWLPYFLELLMEEEAQVSENESAPAFSVGDRVIDTRQASPVGTIIKTDSCCGLVDIRWDDGSERENFRVEFLRRVPR
jgi:hypothetical protein